LHEATEQRLASCSTGACSRRLLEALQRSPGIASLGIFVAGLGLGLLLASAFSAFFWWWAIGAILFGAMLIVATIMAA